MQDLLHTHLSLFRLICHCLLKKKTAGTRQLNSSRVCSHPVLVCVVEFQATSASLSKCRGENAAVEKWHDPSHFSQKTHCICTFHAFLCSQVYICPKHFMCGDRFALRLFVANVCSSPCMQLSKLCQDLLLCVLFKTSIWRTQFFSQCKYDDRSQLHFILFHTYLSCTWNPSICS